MYQAPLPPEYQELSAEEIRERIHSARNALGPRVVILGHHYQRDEIVEHADYLGDSYKLCKDAQRHPEAEFIVFCGVHFMAESADILTDKRVILPNLAAGCSMADMANIFQVRRAWQELEGIYDLRLTIVEDPDEVGDDLALIGSQSRTSQTALTPQTSHLRPRTPLSPKSKTQSRESRRSSSANRPRLHRDLRQSSILPITYINSAANLKAFVGERGGTVCTSTNAPVAVKWALERAEKVLFFPDQHLGRNTGVKLGYDPEKDMCVWDPFKPLGGNTPEKLRSSRFLLWKGHCSVHMRFTVEQVEKARRDYPGCKVIVHPECPLEVVKLADYVGSTEYIIKTVTAGAPGTVWAVGTEINLVSRLARELSSGSLDVRTCGSSEVQEDSTAFEPANSSDRASALPHVHTSTLPKRVFCLDPQICPCSTMYRIHPSFLLWSLENLVAGNVVNEIQVPEETKKWSRVALDRMLELI